ncbi:MAG: GNAT family N-acetyltransferase [Clostridia bacterium]|nr:GNAT family N-acetyltransferase [Clostridia bacterium]
MDYSFRRAVIGDLPVVMEIYRNAQKYMAANGNPQWEEGFPSEEDIKGGIYGGIIYVVTFGGEIAEVFSAVNHDDDYESIEGKWETDGNYLAIHRQAVSEKYRGKGAAKFVLSVAAPEIARERGRKSLRMDTHEKNLPMLTLLESSGAKRCGIITIMRDGSKRIAFEKVL